MFDNKLRCFLMYYVIRKFIVNVKKGIGLIFMLDEEDEKEKEEEVEEIKININIMSMSFSIVIKKFFNKCS